MAGWYITWKSELASAKFARMLKALVGHCRSGVLGWKRRQARTEREDKMRPQPPEEHTEFMGAESQGYVFRSSV
jgi:hypothetical protein